MENYYHQDSLTEAIMRRIYFIFWLRRVAHSPLTKVAILISGGAVGAFLVSVRNVWDNMSRLHGWETMSYSWQATVHTELAVQLTMGIMLLAGLLLLKDFIRRLIWPLVFRANLSWR